MAQVPPTGIERIANTRVSGILLNLILPGAGHFFIREYVFGVFVFLIWLVAASLFYLSFVIDLNQGAKLILFSLPLVFYFFTFFDFLQSYKKKKELKKRSAVFSIVIYAVAIIYQLSVPSAPINFAIANGPIPFVLKNHRLSPLYTQGTLMKASRLAYRFQVLGFGRPFLHHLPDRYDIVRFRSENGARENAVVLGLPQEEIEIAAGTVIINTVPDFEGWTAGLELNGNWPATVLNDGELLVATLNLGAIDEVYRVPVANIIGKVEPFF